MSKFKLNHHLEPASSDATSLSVAAAAPSAAAAAAAAEGRQRNNHLLHNPLSASPHHDAPLLCPTPVRPAPGCPSTSIHAHGTLLAQLICCDAQPRDFGKSEAGQAKQAAGQPGRQAARQAGQTADQAARQARQEAQQAARQARHMAEQAAGNMSAGPWCRIYLTLPRNQRYLAIREQ